MLCILKVAVFSILETSHSEITLSKLNFLFENIDVFKNKNNNKINNKNFDILVVNGCHDMLTLQKKCLFFFERINIPILMIIDKECMSKLNMHYWPIQHFALCQSSIEEIKARIHFCVNFYKKSTLSSMILSIDEKSYVAKIEQRTLDLTFREFELLKYLYQTPGKVFTRIQLLNDVWGYDYFGGTRTVDVHIRRLRAKLGSDFEHMISTVRNVGYIFKNDKKQ